VKLIYESDERSPALPATPAVRVFKVAGDTLTWSSAITSPMPMTLEFEATVAGDAMTGNVKLGAFGNAALNGVRV